MCVETLRRVFMFFQDDLIWGAHMPRFSWTNEHFPTYVLRNTINVCWNPQNNACFSKMINLRVHMHRFTLKMTVFHVYPKKPHKWVLKPFRMVLIFSKTIDLRGYMPRFTLKYECFPMYLLRNHINVCWNPKNSPHFSKTIDFRGHMPRFSWINECFLTYVPGNTINACWNPQDRVCFFKTIDLRGH